jgi:DNA repair exonuclease SbcCD ATPase subunit
MSFQPRARTQRDRGLRPEKLKPKARSAGRAGATHQFAEEHVPTPQEIVERTLNVVRSLGNQRFAVAPFYEHFDRWLLSLKSVLSEFESSPRITLDEQFSKERSQIVSDIESSLKERRLEEASRQEAIRESNRTLIEARSLLAQIEREHAAKAKDITRQRELAVKSVAGRMTKFRDELNRIVRMRAGFLRSISKKTKAQKQAEATGRLDSAKKELADVEKSFAAEQKKAEEVYRRRKQQILEQITRREREIEGLETSIQEDDAVDVRRKTCEALTNAIEELLQRTGALSQTSPPQ